ncbi:hypothetical protein EYF80_017993 [Liparis tanakae]|uniref:Uncharacterized protein n=1 Tax=Liparis tanakae TaxID=230148 RepID=A0A4Z2I3I1_9TELE|nr:hypothetical protein EYF80_017993 [Liparis tanakae]
MQLVKETERTRVREERAMERTEGAQEWKQPEEKRTSARHRGGKRGQYHEGKRLGGRKDQWLEGKCNKSYEKIGALTEKTES